MQNLLLWYTADGWGDPSDAASFAYDKIYNMGGYHPVSLVLSCYTTGMDMVMQAAYVTTINMILWVVWDTECALDYGDCKCDNCAGEFEDISQQFGDRPRTLG